MQTFSAPPIKARNHVMPKATSTTRGREFGRGLEAAIRNAGLSGQAIAEIVGWDPSKISNLACGKGGASEQEVGILLGACRTSPDEREHLLWLYRETHVRGWWQQHGTCGPVRLRTMIEHLHLAESVVSWQTHVVPYYLRTPDYMRAVMLASATIPADEADVRVEAQAGAQKLIWSRPTTFYLHESSLLVPIGGPDVHSEQLRALLCAADLPMITIRTVPFKAGAHAGLSGPFTRLTLRKNESIVWLGHENSDLFIEDPAAIEGYDSITKALDSGSLDIERSKSMIARILAEVEQTRDCP